MTIQEAIKTGRKIKRAACKTYIEARQIIFNIDCIIATDWQVEPEIIEFECEWSCFHTESNSPLAHVMAPDLVDGAGRKELFEKIRNATRGEKTRVRIEVIND